MSRRIGDVVAALPKGGALHAATFERRHQALLFLLLVHVPALAAVAAFRGQPIAHTALDLLPVIAAAVVGRASSRRSVRVAAVTVGLLVAATALVHITGGLVEAHFLFFVLLGFIALYQDWRTYAIVLAWVSIGHGVIGSLLPGAVYNHPDAVAHPWKWAAVHGTFTALACISHIVFLKVQERHDAEVRRSFAQLYDSERAVVERLRKAQTLKDELMSVVGHEFRTPLTAIQGYARTLEARLETMDPARARASAVAIEREAKKLTRMVANLLTASEELEPRPTDRCELADVAHDAVVDVVELAPAMKGDITVHVPPGHVVAMSPDAVRQVMFNLLDNAAKFADTRTDIRVSSRQDGASVVLEVTNVGPPVPEPDRERIFDAFVQGDSSDTRQYGGIGLGLYIVRKIVVAYGGRIGVSCDGPVVVFRVWLPSAPQRQLPAGLDDSSQPVALNRFDPALGSQGTARR